MPGKNVFLRNKTPDCRALSFSSGIHRQNISALHWAVAVAVFTLATALMKSEPSTSIGFAPPTQE